MPTHQHYLNDVKNDLTPLVEKSIKNNTKFSSNILTTEMNDQMNQSINEEKSLPKQWKFRLQQKFEEQSTLRVKEQQKGNETDLKDFNIKEALEGILLEKQEEIVKQVIKKFVGNKEWVVEVGKKLKQGDPDEEMFAYRLNKNYNGLLKLTMKQKDFKQQQVTNFKALTCNNKKEELNEAQEFIKQNEIKMGFEQKQEQSEEELKKIEYIINEYPQGGLVMLLLGQKSKDFLLTLGFQRLLFTKLGKKCIMFDNLERAFRQAKKMEEEREKQGDKQLEEEERKIREIEEAKEKVRQEEEKYRRELVEAEEKKLLREARQEAIKKIDEDYKELRKNVRFVDAY